jgi:MYXO-CTERM domain-containing protein
MQSVVTDHRMAFQVSTKQTVLWDQIRYSGNPSEFAWVLPVRPGTVIEPSTTSFFSTLETFTVPTIFPPRPAPTGGGCSFGCSASKASSVSEDGGAAFDGGVTVVSEKDVGPYASVTVRSTDPNALTDWLTQNGYVIPPSLTSTIAAYVTEQFDFIALKLRPGQGIRAMKPVRVVYAGADNSLPLRMVAAGVGAQVGITLFVVGEGRYHTQNFPDATIDYDLLTWDFAASKSNYAQLSLDAMAQNGGRSWLTEFAGALSPTLLDNAYQPACKNELRSGPTDGGAPDSSSDASDEAGEGGSMDASADAESDAGEDADASVVQNGCDDITVATKYLHPLDTWVTRLRGNLPVAALAADLKLEASADQSAVSNSHTVGSNTYGARGGSSCSATPANDIAGSVAEGAAGLFAVAAILRRRRRQFSHGR